MDWTYLILLLPGIITEKLIASLSVRREKSQFEAISMALLYSFISVLFAFSTHMMFYLSSWNKNLFQLERPVFSIENGVNIHVNLFMIILWSIIIAIYSIYYINNDGHRVLRDWSNGKFTKRQTFPDVWSNLFWHRRDLRARIEMRNGTTVDATIVSFDEDENGHLVLASPTWYYKCNDNWDGVPAEGFCVLVKIQDVVSILMEDDKDGKSE